METIYCNKRGKCKRSVVIFNMELIKHCLDNEILIFCCKAFNLKLK